MNSAPPSDFSPARRHWLTAALAVSLVPRFAWAGSAPDMRIDDFRRLVWNEVAGGRPLIQPPSWSPVLADPALVLPADSPDGQWHLFAHSAAGIHHHTAPDGVSWTREEMAVWHGMRAFVLAHQGEYLLYYEDYPAFALVRTALPDMLRSPWNSRISCRRSKDLRQWGPAEPMLEPTLPWHGNALGRAVGNPCVVRLSEQPGSEQWALYYSGGLVFIADCGFTEPYGVGRATAPSPQGPWKPESEPLLKPANDDAAMNLSGGAIKVLRCADGFVGFHNAITWDRGHSRSAIYLLWSEDGRRWQRSEKPLLAPSGDGWRRSHIYACDVRFDARSGSWWLFYNARNDWPMNRGREAIGALRAG